MRVTEIIVEALAPSKDRFVPPVVFHGTNLKNLSNILRYGLKPKYNKWLNANPMHGGGILQKEKMGPKVVSTHLNVKIAVDYAKQGGSTGWGFDEDRGVVLAFKPLPTDKFEIGGFQSNEVEFYNTIEPERLYIAWPESMKGRLSDRLAKAQQANTNQANKTALIKNVNQQLRAVGSPYVAKSQGTPNKMRVRIQEPENNTSLGSLGWKDFDLMSPEFRQWLGQQVKE